MSPTLTKRPASDVLRSLHKYVALLLPDEYEVRFWDAPGEFKRPFARVAKIGPLLTSGPAAYTDVTQLMAIHTYPVIKETVEECIFGAEAIEELLYDGFRVGVGLGRPLRVPLWDWKGVPLDGVNSDTTTRHPHDYIKIVPESLQINRLHEPVDDRLITVVTDLRVTWRRPARTFEGNTVQSLTIEIDAVS